MKNLLALRCQRKGKEMVYEQIDELAAPQVKPLEERLLKIAATIETNRLLLPNEDSRKKQEELKDHNRALKRERQEINGSIHCIKTDIFKRLLGEEYGVTGNPKFEKAYYIAYEHGHSSGFSDIEIYFSELSDLIK